MSGYKSCQFIVYECVLFVSVISHNLLDGFQFWVWREGDSIPVLRCKFVAEVVSSNWQNDYARKVEDYAVLGIPEYWIADYAGLGGTRHIGKPKQPTLSICTLVDGEYEIQQFRGNQTITSTVFPGLKLTAEQGQISPVTCCRKCVEYCQHQFAGTIYYVWDMKELVMFLKVLSENVLFVVKVYNQ